MIRYYNEHKIFKYWYNYIDIYRLNRFIFEKLYRYVLCNSAEELRRLSKWSGSKGGSRSFLVSKLKEFLSPTIILSENRLLHLLSQVFPIKNTNKQTKKKLLQLIFSIYNEKLVSSTATQQLSFSQLEW